MITMKSAAITGIGEQAIHDLRRNGMRTIELRSPHNFLTVLETTPGDHLFLTHATTNDLTNGTRGLITKIQGKETVMHRVFQGKEGYYEEREALLARLQLELCGIGRIRKVEERGLGRPTIVVYDEIQYLDAR